MASTAAAAAAAAMAAQCASLSLASPSSAASSLTSPFTGLSLRRRVSLVPVVQPRSVTVQAKGGFIPAEHRWMYEDVEKMGPVSTLFTPLHCLANRLGMGFGQS